MNELEQIVMNFTGCDRQIVNTVANSILSANKTILIEKYGATDFDDLLNGIGTEQNRLKCEVGYYTITIKRNKNKITRRKNENNKSNKSSGK